MKALELAFEGKSTHLRLEREQGSEKQSFEEVCTS